MAVELKPLAPQEAIDYFQKKGYRPGFAWQDVWQEEHARAFTVAKAMRLDLLEDIRRAMDDAIKNGTTLDQFRKELTPVLQAKGWWGRQEMTDPLTGEMRPVQLGSPRRLKIIFDTNMRTAYAAGHWERIQRLKGRRPYLRYTAVLDNRTRPAHRLWHGTVLRVDDAWWNQHYPPNGWNCRCSVQQLSEADLKRYGFRVNPSPGPPITQRWRNPRTGERVDVPQGIDPGWAYNVGKAHLKGLTPPPESGPLPMPYSGPPADTPMPPSRPAPESRLLPAGLSETEYLDRFLAEFGAARGRPTVFTDVTGEPIVIGEQMFTDAQGRLKVKKQGRDRYLLLLADTIKQPDEVWLQWEEYPTGSFTLRRRYLARWDMASGRVRRGLGLFVISRDGWSGLTSFTPETVAYFMRQRGGQLIYRRP